MRLLAICLVVLALVGCGDDGDGGGGQVSTGLDDDQVLGEISGGQAAMLCDSLAESTESAISADDLARLPCTIAAFSAPGVIEPDGSGGGTINREACEASVTDCLENPSDPVETEECSSQTVVMELAGCDATAGELEACMNASLPQIRNLLRLISCTADLSQMPPDFEEPAACASLDMKCPGVLDAVGGVALPELGLGDDEETGSFDGGAP